MIQFISVIQALLSISQFYNGLLRLLHTFSPFSIWFMWLEIVLFWTNFLHFLWQGLQSLFCQPSISMVTLNSGLIWLKMDISLRLKMPYLHDKCQSCPKEHIINIWYDKNTSENIFLYIVRRSDCRVEVSFCYLTIFVWMLSIASLHTLTCQIIV